MGCLCRAWPPRICWQTALPPAPRSASKASAIGWSGMAPPPYPGPPVVTAGTGPLGKTTSAGPGQKDWSQTAGQGRYFRDICSRVHGSNVEDQGIVCRPAFSSKDVAGNGLAFKPLAPRPYTVSVGKATRPPAAGPGSCLITDCSTGHRALAWRTTTCNTCGILLHPYFHVAVTTRS